MEQYTFRRVGPEEIETIKELFVSVFTAAPWNDDWSDAAQLDAYIRDLIAQSNSLAYALYEGENMIALAMGRIKHWYEGTEYCIDELCVKTDRQGKGIGTDFLARIEHAIHDTGLTHIFLLTERTVPAYRFYKKNGFYELEDIVAFGKRSNNP